MFGIFLMFSSGILAELGTSIGKASTANRAIDIYTFGFLNLFFATIFLIGFGILHGSFVFSEESLPTFGIRLLLEILQAEATVRAISIADRSTYSFLRIWTIPLLLLVDVVLGYSISVNSVIGISLIVFSFIILFINHGINKKGSLFVIFTALNAVITLSLYKYDITHFNSVEAEQGIISLVLLGYFFIMAFRSIGKNPISFLRNPLLLFQSFSMGASGVLVSFAYLYAPASIISAVGRSISVLFSIISGNMYFNEKKLFVKIIALFLIVAGMIFFVI